MDKGKAIETIFEEKFKDSEIVGYKEDLTEDFTSAVDIQPYTRLTCIPINEEKTLGFIWKDTYTTTMTFRRVLKNRLSKLTNGNRDAYNIHTVSTKDLFYIRNSLGSLYIPVSAMKLIDIDYLLNNPANKVTIGV